MDRSLKTGTILSVLCMLVLVLPACNLATNPDDTNNKATTFTLAFDPSPVENPGVGNTQNVDVMVSGAINLIAARFTVTYDPAVLEISNVSVSGWGYLFEDAGATVNEIERSIDNAAGVCTIGIGGIGKGFTGASGDGALATVVFTAKTAGATTLGFSTSGDDTIMSMYSVNTDTLIASNVQAKAATVTAVAAATAPTE